jgi:putative colanic acid biosynthesis acetyltransferase WcaF
MNDRPTEILDAKAVKPQEGGPSFSLGNRVERLIWGLAWMLLARWTPAILNSWRASLLKLFGAQIGRGAVIHASSRVWLPRNLVMREFAAFGPGVDCYNMARVEVGAYAIVSQRAVLCAGTHEIDDPTFQLVARPIVIGTRAWIATEAFVGPGVAVGEGAVLGARACAFRALEPWTVYVGNPAMAVKPRRVRDD